ncbi:MAG: 5'-3' exonuclease [Chloroflexota bacterium]
MTILLLDGHNLLYRSFRSIPASVVDSEGRPINALYGMLSLILRLGRELRPAGIVVALDVPEAPTFRHLLYPAYQGQRGPLGGDEAPSFERQVAAARHVLPTVGVPVLSVPGYEADDVMATLAVRAAEYNVPSIIMSTDRDLLQMVRPNIEILVPATPPRPVRNAEEVRERVGVNPDGIPTWKALAGDPSDNIPGVAGVGTKTAAALVNQFGTLEAIYERLDDHPLRVRRALETGRENAFLYRRIVTLVVDLALPLGPTNLPELVIDPATRARSILQAAGY